MITLKDVEHNYCTKNNEKLALKRINLNIEKGEIIGIIGRPGSGKSALLKCMDLVERPKTGIISIDKKNSSIMMKQELIREKQEIGVVSQNPSFIRIKNVFTNIALPLELKGVPKQSIFTAVNKIASILNLSDKLSLHINQLTHVQRQKVAIARALIINPKILICDEITVGLDNKTIQSIIKIIKEINSELQTTIIMATNDVEIIKKLCGKIYVMHQGEIIEQTNSLDLFVNPKTDVAKEFIRSYTRLEIPWIYRRSLHVQKFRESHPIARIAFTGNISSEILLTQAISDYQIRTIIIQGHQEYIEDTIVNILLLEITGEHENIEKSIQYLKSNNLQVEILGYVSNNR